MCVAGEEMEPEVEVEVGVEESTVGSSVRSETGTKVATIPGNAEVAAAEEVVEEEEVS